MILENRVNLEELKKENDTEKVREKLLTLSGVGPKVADCNLLFSDLKRWEVFPIDVWVRRVMNELYIHNADETKVNKKRNRKTCKGKVWKFSRSSTTISILLENEFVRFDKFEKK